MGIDRIIPPQKALSLIKDHQASVEESSLLSLMYLPLIPGRKKQHCHVSGTWQGCRVICVAFKRRGEQGGEHRRGRGKGGKVGKKEMDGTRPGVGTKDKGKYGQEGDEQKLGALCMRKEEMMMKKDEKKKMTRPDRKKNKDDKSNKSTSNRCLVPRKRMKMIANR